MLAGLFLDILAFLMARYGPQGGDAVSWSFRGNGALVVPLGLGPAVVAGTWAALVFRARGVPHWLRLGVFGGIIGTSLVCASILLLVVFGSAAQRLSDLLTLPVWLWMAVAPLVAAVWPVERHGAATDRAMYFTASVVFPFALVATFELAGKVLSPGS